MNVAKKIYNCALAISLLPSLFLYADEISTTKDSLPVHTLFKPNKRHIHEKKEVKKESTEKKFPHRAARIHTKQESNKKIEPNNSLVQNIEKKEDVYEKHISENKHHSIKKAELNTPEKIMRNQHHTKIARHHKKEPELKEAKKETSFQKIWGKIKSFFSGKKTT